MTLRYQAFKNDKSIRTALQGGPPLKRGNKGSGVRILQEALIKLGYKLPNSTKSTGRLDGHFGKETAAALKKFQRTVPRITPNGEAGATTLSALDKVLPRHNEKLSKPPTLEHIQIPDYLRIPSNIGIPAPLRSFLGMSASLRTPTAAGLDREFACFRTIPQGRLPCRRSRAKGITGPIIHNQCAVRMSVALSRSMGRDILENYTGKLKHKIDCCAGDNPAPHITGSTDLLKHLENTLKFKFEEYNSKSHTQLKNRKGIIFFKRCFTKFLRDENDKKIPLRDEEGVIKINEKGKVRGYQRDKSGKKGSHIDYWNGETYTNAATGSASASKKLVLFKRAEKIYFYELK